LLVLLGLDDSPPLNPAESFLDITILKKACRLGGKRRKSKPKIRTPALAALVVLPQSNT
jgi:hypothetical protein